MGVPPALSDLIAAVLDHAAADDPLVQLDEAIAMSGRLADSGDLVLDHFVTAARQAGCSWTVIGTQLGVSKQAARQRFAGRTGELCRALPLATPRLRTCLAAAEDEAARDGSAEVGTHHLLRGLLTEGVAAGILDQLGVTADGIRASSTRLFGPGEPTGEVPRPSDETSCALTTAADHAARQIPNCADRFVGSEHVLLALVLDPGSRATRVLTDLGVAAATVEHQLAHYVTPKLRSRLTRRRRRPAEPVCSFCRRPRRDVGVLVAGPGVWICASCTELADQEHAARTSSRPRADRAGA